MALVYRAGGWSGLMILTAAAAGVAAAIVAFHVRRYLRVDLALLLIMLALACGAGSLLARPHLIALPLLALWTVALAGARARGEAPSFALLPMMIVWANLHGGFLAGVVLAAALGLEAALDPTCNRREQAGKWALFLLAAILAALITPHGIDGLLFPFRMLAMRNLNQIHEWMPADMGHVTGLPIAVLLTIYLGLTCGVALPKFRVALLTGLLFAAMQHGRNVQVFAVEVPLLMAGCLGRVAVPVWPAKLLRIEYIAGGVMLLAALVSLSVRAAVPLSRVDAGYYAPAALEHVPAGLRVRPVLNEYGFGGLLIFSGIRPFIDGRSDVYGDAGMADYLNIVSARDNALDAALCRYDIAWTIFSPNTVVPALMDRTPGWHRLYGDAAAVVHVRDSDVRLPGCPDRPVLTACSSPSRRRDPG